MYTRDPAALCDSTDLCHQCKCMCLLTTCSMQDINAVDEAKKNLAARGTPMPDDWCKVVQMRAARA